MSISPLELQEVFSKADQIYSQSQVESAIEALGDAITEKLYQKNPIILCVMTGGIVLTGKLLTQLVFPLTLDYTHLTRYRGNTQGGEVQWIMKPRHTLKDRVVLLVDDILDEGYTLKALQAHCKVEGVAELYTCVLIEKKHNRRVDGVTADFIGLTTPDHYLFGYGLDYHEYWRNAPGIYAVHGL